MRAAVAAQEAPTDSAAAAAPQRAHGFELVREQFVPEYDSLVLTYRHTKTGACLLLHLGGSEATICHCQP